MALKEKLTRLVEDKSTPNVSILLNTHRTHPDNLKDEIKLKNFLSEAESRVTNEFGKRPVAPLLEKLSNVQESIDPNHNLESLHIFLSNDVQEIIRSTSPISNEGVHISDSFAVRSLIKAYGRRENYLLMLLSQSGVHLYEAMNDTIIEEVMNVDFPFGENLHYSTFADKRSDPKHVDNLVREFLNKVDKALVKVHQETNLACVVICNEDIYSRLQQVADKPEIYLGYAAVDYNNTSEHHIVKQAWELIQPVLRQRKLDAVSEVQEAVPQGAVLTDLQEIYQASIDGRGDLLLINQDFSQPVMMKDERTFNLINDVTKPNAIDDISSSIVWEVIEKGGRVVFLPEGVSSELGAIALKTRY